MASLGEADVVVGGVGTAGAAVGMGPKRLEDGTPVWLQLGYGAERSRLAVPTPLDAVERFILGVGVGTESTR